MSRELPTAAEARATVERSAQAQSEAQIMDLRNKISHAIRDGKMDMTCYAMKPGTQAYLESLGYAVKHIDALDQRDSESWTVSW